MPTNDFGGCLMKFIGQKEAQKAHRGIDVVRLRTSNCQKQEENSSFSKRTPMLSCKKRLISRSLFLTRFCVMLTFRNGAMKLHKSMTTLAEEQRMVRVRCSQAARPGVSQQTETPPKHPGDPKTKRCLCKTLPTYKQ